MDLEAKMSFLVLCLGLFSTCGALSIYKRSVNVEQCPGTGSCLSPAQMIVDWMEHDDAKPLHTLAYPAILDSVCRQKNNISGCLNATTCNVFEVTHKGIAVMAALDYICGGGRTDFLSEVNCFARDSVYSSLQLCSNILNVRLDIFSEKHDAGNAQTEGFCKSTVDGNMTLAKHVKDKTVAEKAGLPLMQKTIGDLQPGPAGTISSEEKSNRLF